jgi:hypothetical protein
MVEKRKRHANEVVEEDRERQNKNVLPFAPEIEDQTGQEQDQILGFLPGEEIGGPNARQEEEQEKN